MSLSLRTSGLLLVLLGLILASSVMYKFKHELTNDRDGYLALATGINDGYGFADPLTRKETAYRPLMYPALLSLFLRWTNSAALAVVLINGLSFLLILQIARRIKPEIVSLTGEDPSVTRKSAALKDTKYFQLIFLSLVLCDPLILYYSAQPMTEVLSCYFVILLCYRLINIPWGDNHFETRQVLDEVLNKLLDFSFVIGMAVLLRPTFLIMLAGVLIWLVCGYLAKSFKLFLANKWGLFMVINVNVVFFLIPVLFWGVRNHFEMGKFIATTTHGGYTLYLANNESFYRTVVDQHPLKVWELPAEHPDSQQAWWSQLQREMIDKGLNHEVQRDEYLAAQAKEFITNNPGRFVKACLYRIFWFWSPVPLTNHASLPWYILWGVILFYTVENICCFVGMGMIIWRREYFTFWGLCMVMILSYEFLHLFYWTNARMRIPVIPLIAILAARTFVVVIQSKVVRGNSNPPQIPVAP